MTAIVITGVGAFVLALILAQLCKPLARRAGVVARPKADRWHRQVVPLLGGVAIAGAVGIMLAIHPVHSPQLLVLIAGAGALFLIGLIDDVRPFRPQSKFVWQILVAAAVASFGLQLNLTGSMPFDMLLTLFWIVGITNAFNLLDNMDGLSAGVAAITAGFHLAFSLNGGNLEAAQVAAAVVGACLGFLIHNFNPASIFMGDAGSLFLGVMVGGLSLASTSPASRSTVSVLLFPVLILLVPIFDTTFVTIARTLAGRPVSRGGRDHTSHRLVASGLSERGAVVLLYAVALVCGGVAYQAHTSGLSANIVFVVFLAIGLMLFGFYLGRVKVYPDAEQAEVPERGVVRLIESLPYKRQVATVMIDSVLIVLAYYCAYRLRFEQTFKDNELWFVSSTPIVFMCQLCAFAAFRVYQGVWRYTSLPDLIRLGKAAVVGTGGAVLALVLLYRFEGYSRAVFVIDGILLLMFVGGSRLSFRIFDEVLRGQALDSERVLIYGAGDGGDLAIREMRGNPGLRRTVVGFLDDNRWKHRTLIQGVPVLGGLDRLVEIVDLHQVNEVIVSTGKIGPDRIDELAEICERRGVRLTRVWREQNTVVAS